MNTTHNHSTDNTHNAGFPPAAPQAPTASREDEAWQSFFNSLQALQFFPTPRGLAKRMWSLFKNRDFARVLEPQAGDGALIDASPWSDQNRMYRRDVPVDCCEIDIKHHALLREKGAAVVGLDFLQFQSGAIYSHVIMNPPFRDGVSHVLKAWNLLWNGEIVALLNAESVKNAFSGERRLLAQIIAEHGTVEYIDNAFMVEEAERKTPVSVALVHLTKTANMADVYGDVLAGLRADDGADMAPEGNAADMLHELALPGDFVRLAVRSFDAAVIAMREAVHAEAKAQHYVSRLGRTMAQHSAAASAIGAGPSSAGWIQGELSERYKDLKDRAWANILRSTEVTAKLSSGAQRSLESEFENIKRLEFTVPNIYGFLCGLVCNQGAMQIEMAAEVFDLFSRYHNDNAVYYRGWVSNGKHRTCGHRLKMTRFVLPRANASYSRQFSWETERMLADIDKVFAMLDGKPEPEISLVSLSKNHYGALSGGERVSSSYFDLRYYPGVGTLHFFPTNKKLVDRLNRMVGRHRAWLPDEGVKVSDGFWQQFDQAEKLDKEVRQEARKNSRNRWDDPLRPLGRADSDPECIRAHETLDAVLMAVHTRHEIPTEFRIEHSPQSTPQALQLPLLAA